MARLTTDDKAKVLGMLVEDASIRSVERMTGVHRDTITKVVVKAGAASERVLRENICHVQANQPQLDEVWAFVGKKRNHVRMNDNPAEVGDFWTWVALDPDTKLVPHHHVGKRNEREAVVFMGELRNRIEGRVQISTDKLAAYRWAINLAWDGEVDYGRIVKRFKVEPASFGRYSPPSVVAVEKDAIMGDPDMAQISTSHVERSNLTMRMSIQRLTRLTNGFSKKVENLRAAVNLHFAHYNFIRTHRTIKTPPAIAAGLMDKPMTLGDLAYLAG